MVKDLPLILKKYLINIIIIIIKDEMRHHFSVRASY